MDLTTHRRNYRADGPPVGSVQLFVALAMLQAPLKDHTATDVGHAIRANKRGVIEHLQAFEADGFLTIRPDPGGRSKLYRLTTLGVETLRNQARTRLDMEGRGYREVAKRLGLDVSAALGEREG